jgi:hypothetical protein
MAAVRAGVTGIAPRPVQITRGDTVRVGTVVAAAIRVRSLICVNLSCNRDRREVMAVAVPGIVATAVADRIAHRATAEVIPPEAVGMPAVGGIARLCCGRQGDLRT